MKTNLILVIHIKLTLAFFFFISTSAFAQSNDESAQINSGFKLHQKSDIFINWGYNRCWFNNSDIHFYGQGHDFVLYDVKASDRPSPLSLDYVNPSTWSIPQFNFRIGYFITDKYSISVGWDHMKYVAEDFQNVKMYGYLDTNVVVDPLMRTNMEKLNTQYAPDGLYDNTMVQMMPEDFIHYEHTDGLNYASTELERYDELWQMKSYDKVGITLVTGGGLGLIIPRTDSHLFGSGENHYWNIAGWGCGAKVGLQISFLKHFYFQSDFKLGYLDMINVHTSNHYNIDKAKQNIVYYENHWLLGFRF